MTTAYVAVGYLTDESGERKKFGQVVEIASTTDEEKANLARLLDYGIVTLDKPQSEHSGREGK